MLEFILIDENACVFLIIKIEKIGLPGKKV
jgi:hypothetical protein